MTFALPAATFTWQPSGDGSWTNAANWSGGTLPTTTNDTANFNTVITSPATVTLDGNQNINKINFSSAAAVGWTINPGTPGSSTLTLGGASPGIAVSLGIGGSATIGVVINSTTGWSYTGSSGLSLTGANTFNAPVNIQSATSSGTVGVLTINSLGNVGGGPSALGSPSTAANGVISLGRLSNLTYTGPATSSDRLLKFISSNGGQTTINNSGSGLLTLTGGITNSGNGVTFILRGAEDITESGVISLGAAGLLNTDVGTLTLTGSNSFSGGTTVSAGTLLVNNSTGSGTGSGTVTVASGATFGGTGHISGGVVFNSGANASFTVGSPLTIGGSLTISNNPVHLNIPFSLTNGTYSLATYNSSGSTGSFVAVPLADSGSLPAGKVIAITTAGGAVNLSVSNPVVTSFIYYVATNGNDAFTSVQATNSATPWRTLSHAVTNLNAGDTCVIRGGTYRETVVVPVSGVTNALVTFQAYSNEVVTIDGTDPISGWSASGGNIWSAPMNWTLGTGDQVFSNQTMLPSARWPNASSSFPWQNSSINPSPDWTYTTAAGYDANGANGWFSDTNLPSRPDGYWNGATVNILNGKGWVMSHMTVLGYTNATRTIQTSDASGNNANYALIPGNEFYITGVMGELDSPGEWFYTNSLLYVYSTNTPAGVTAKHRQFGFDLRGRAFITLKNLHFFGCNIQSDANSTDENYDGLVIQFPGYSSVNSSNAGLTLYDRSVLRNSELAWDSYSLLTFAGDDIWVINNYFHDSGFVPGWPAAVNVVTTPCYRNLFSHNTITNTGRESIGAIGKTSIIEYNDMSYPLKLESDGGVLHVTYEAGNTVFRYNRLHDAPGPKGHTGISSGLGFYLDSQCSNWIVHHNCMWNVPFGGIQVNLHRNFNLFFNNTVWGANTSLSGGGALSDGPSGVCFFNNLFNTSPAGSPWTDSDLRYNFYTNTSFVAASSGDFRLQASSPAIGAGTVIPGVTDGFTGAAPDLGAFEYGGANWATNTGYSTNPPSPDPTYNLPNMVFANQVVDGSFESGNLSPNWTTNAGSSLILLYSSASAWTDTRLHMGYYSVQFNPGTSGISQTITGLLANCSYQLFAGIEITNPACTAVLGVTNCGPAGSTLMIPGNPLNTNLWTMFMLPFTTGPTNTSAQIYLNVTIPNGATPVYADDFSVQVNTLGATNTAPYSSPSTPAGLSGITNGNFQLSWTAAPGATYYSVLRATTSSGPFTILLTGLTTNVYTDTNPVPFATNYYIVAAGNAFGVSSNSNQISFTYSPALYFRYVATTNLWNSTSNFWGAVSGGSYTNLWTDYSTATFEGTGGTVTINGIGVNVFSNLNFNVNGYTLAATNGGVLNLRGSNVLLNASNTVQFSAPLVTDSGSLLNFNCPTGNTAVVLSGNNTIGGQINITQGKVLLNYNYVLNGCTGVMVGNGGSLQVGNQNNFSISGILASITGAGVNGGASALEGFSSSVCGWGGPVTLTGNSSIGARQGAFNVSGVISDNSNGYGLTVNNKTGSLYATGTVILSATNTYGGATAVAAGTLLVNGILDSGAVTVSNTATLGGGGVINGQVIIQGGGTLALGVGGLATLTVSNALTMLAGSTNWMKINGSTLAGDQIAGISAVTYGGCLIVTNIGGISALTNGARVVLFSAATYNPSAFAFTNLPPLATNLIWDTSQLTINGSLQVKSVVVPTPVISRVALNGGSLVIQGTNGPPGSGYSILTATNLTQPSVQWLTNTTGIFNSLGWFSNELPFYSTEPQRFYRVRTP